MINSCVHLREFLEVEMPAINRAIERNQWYLGEKGKCYFSEEEAREDFFERHLSPYWGKIFKALYCEYKCIDGKICKLGLRGNGVAKKFKIDVEEKGIDAILSGGNDTEAIFERYRREVDGE